MQDQAKPLIVCAKFKGAPGEPPRFSKSLPIEQLFLSLMETLPVDDIYAVAQIPDSEEYVFTKVGTIVLDMLSGPALESAVNAPGRKIPQNGTPNLPLVKNVEPESNLEVSEGSEDLDYIPNQPIYLPREEAKDTNPFSFSKPKSQKELLRERGLEQPPSRLSKSFPKIKLDSKDSNKLEDKKEALKKKVSKLSKADGKKRTASIDKVSAPQGMDDPNDNSWERDLPPPIRSGMGRAQVTKIHQATQAQAASATKFRIGH